MKRLSATTLPDLAARDVSIPSYEWRDTTLGVVHFGPGAFHRVHQAFYFDQVLVFDNRWGICEVALQSSDVRDALAPQDGLYSLAILDAERSLRIIASTRKYLAAKESSQAVLKQLTAPNIRLITATITEKGYCLTPDGDLDLAHADILRDLQTPQQPTTFIGYVVETLRQRRDQQLAPPNIISCDNLTANGHRLRRAVLSFAREVQPDLVTWIEDQVAFPRTMVDSITPATDDALRTHVEQVLGLHDAWPVQREAFTQWVIEDSLRGEVPDWNRVGVTLTHDVDGYEKAKLRLLNGAHSSLAYIGLAAGFDTVSQAIADPALSIFISQLMHDDISPTVVAPHGLDVRMYIESLLRRFRNAMLPHRLAQIAWDGSQKIPFRLLGTITDQLARGHSIQRLCAPIAAWFHFVRRKANAGERVTDPLTQSLFATGQSCSGAALQDCRQFLALTDVFPEALATNKKFIHSVVSAYALLAEVHCAADLPVFFESLRNQQ